MYVQRGEKKGLNGVYLTRRPAAQHNAPSSGASSLEIPVSTFGLQSEFMQTERVHKCSSDPHL